MNDTALLLIAHGSRRREANQDLEWLADAFRAAEEFGHVQPAYLELTEPTIHAGGTICAERGPARVVMLPYFLSPGVHVREDLIEARDKLRAAFPHVSFDLAEPLGRHPLLIDIVRQRVHETGPCS